MSHVYSAPRSGLGSSVRFSALGVVRAPATGCAMIGSTTETQLMERAVATLALAPLDVEWNARDRSPVALCVATTVLVLMVQREMELAFAETTAWQDFGGVALTEFFMKAQVARRRAQASRRLPKASRSGHYT